MFIRFRRQAIYYPLWTKGVGTLITSAMKKKQNKQKQKQTKRNKPNQTKTKQKKKNQQLEKTVVLVVFSSVCFRFFLFFHSRKPALIISVRTAAYRNDHTGQIENCFSSTSQGLGFSKRYIMERWVGELIKSNRVVNCIVAAIFYKDDIHAVNLLWACIITVKIGIKIAKNEKSKTI